MDNNTTGIISDDLEKLSEGHRTVIFRDRTASNVRWLTSNYLAIDWSLFTNQPTIFLDLNKREMEVVEFPTSHSIGVAIHETTDSVYNHLLLNKNHPLVQWLMLVKDTSQLGQYDLKEEQFRRLLSLLYTPLRYRGHELKELANYIEKWRSLPSLPTELYPPEIELTGDMFSLENTSPHNGNPLLEDK